MDRTLELRTPESIVFSYELAGLGSRFLAMLADVIVQIVIAILIVWGLASLPHGKTAPLSSSEEKWVQSFVVAIVVFFVFAIFFGYFIIFEAAWNGQTIGKRLLGIRVVRDGGYPVDFMGSLIRNLVRAAEFALGFYALSAIVMLFSDENKRLGDYAAGTIVVRDARIEKPEFAGAGPFRTSQFTDEERALAARFIDRRGDLLAENRARLARQIADVLRPKVTDPEVKTLDDETLIERVDSALR
jgi:uncharacterized RDD family membrane protein YckC